MDDEDRLNALEMAHRSLAAEHTALMQVCKLMLPLIAAPESTIRSALVAALDGANNSMEASEFDDAYQAEVREWIDHLSAVILDPVLASTRQSWRGPQPPAP